MIKGGNIQRGRGDKRGGGSERPAFQCSQPRLDPCEAVNQGLVERFALIAIKEGLQLREKVGGASDQAANP